MRLDIHLHHHFSQPLILAGQAEASADLMRINQKLHNIMSAVSDFAAKQNTHNQKITTAVEGLSSDIAALNDLITKLQNTAGQITPEDQALLDQIEASSAAVATKLEALDNLTPPTPPPA